MFLIEDSFSRRVRIKQSRRGRSNSFKFVRFRPFMVICVVLLSIVGQSDSGISAQVYVPSPYVYPSFWTSAIHQLQFLSVLVLCFPLVLLDVFYFSHLCRFFVNIIQSIQCISHGFVVCSHNSKCTSKIINEGGGPGESGVGLSDLEEDEIEQGEVKQYGIRHEKLDYYDVYKILGKPIRDRIESDNPPIRPVTGSVFLFNIGAKDKRRERRKFRCDHYQWAPARSHNSEHKDIPIITQNVSYIHVKGGGYDKGFSRTEFWIKGQEDLMLTQYLGDQNIYIPHPHGNSKHTRDVFIPARPEVKERILSEGLMLKPRTAMMKAVNHTEVKSGYEPSLLPRNLQQVYNHRKTERRNYHITPDRLYNVHELLQELPHFFKSAVEEKDNLKYILVSDLIYKHSNWTQIRPVKC